MAYRYNAERGAVDSNNFNVWFNGALQFRCERELYRGSISGEVKRGHWLLFKCGPNGSSNRPIDRDQYSNDILERIQLGLYDDFTLLEDRVGQEIYHDCNPLPPL